MIITHRYDSLDLRHGGTIRFVVDLCEAMARRGHDVLIACDEKGDRPAEIPEANSLSDRPGSTTGRLRAVTHPDLIQSALQSSDVVHFNGVWNPRFTTEAKHCASNAVPYIVSPHGMLDVWSMSQRAIKKRLYYILRGAKFLRSASRVHVTAQGELSQSRRWFEPATPRIIPCLIDLRPYRAGVASLERANPHGLDPSRPIVLFLGRLHPKKGAEIFIDAAAQLLREHSSPQFVLAGSGDPAYVEQLKARAQALSAQIRFIGHIDGEQKHVLLAHAAVFVLPTLQENFGIAIVEAIASGTPAVITTGVDIWPELCQAGVAVTANRTGEDFASAIRPFLRYPKDKALMQQCRRFVDSQFDSEAVADQYDAMYKDVVDRRRDGKTNTTARP